MATVVGNRIAKAGHQVVQVWGRNEENAKSLAGMLGNGSFSSDPAQLYPRADLYIMAIADDAIENLAGKLKVNDRVVVHTAGSVSKDVLKPSSKNYGVLYPLQSLRKERIEPGEIPFLIDGNTADDLTFIFEFARTISPKVEMAGDSQRLHLHLAAVMVNNFVNHLYTRAYAYCQGAHVDFGLLLPLISETAARISNESPAHWQTGPAMRNDKATIGTHLSLLKDQGNLAKLYEVISEDILKYYYKPLLDE